MGRKGLSRMASGGRYRVGDRFGVGGFEGEYGDQVVGYFGWEEGRG